MVNAFYDDKSYLYTTHFITKTNDHSADSSEVPPGPVCMKAG